MLKDSRRTYSDLLEAVPPEWNDPDIREKIIKINHSRNKKIIVLDDDPTGVQTVHNVQVLTTWDQETLKDAFESSDSIFFILTNTRAYDEATVRRINQEIAKNVFDVANIVNKDFCFISRSDSTLRGYYPLEVDILSKKMKDLAGIQYDGHLIIPAFFEGGRYTYGNIHYLEDSNYLVPVNETEFAQDRMFAFKQADLTKWVVEKSNGRFSEEDCFTISVNQLRQGPDAVENLLLEVNGGRPVIINALSYKDLDVLSLALLRAESGGKRFIYRTAASFVKSIAGISDIELLSKNEMISEENKHKGGIIIVGSHVNKTTRQLTELLNLKYVTPLEMKVENILSEKDREKEIIQISKEVVELINAGINVVVYSSRGVISAANKEDNLRVGRMVSVSLVKIIQSLTSTPKFIIAKGGITSSDIATVGLEIKKATVLGQAAPGIPVWKTGSESRFPDIPYIIFPGNVGSDTTLADIVSNLSN